MRVLHCILATDGAIAYPECDNSIGAEYTMKQKPGFQINAY